MATVANPETASMASAASSGAFGSAIDARLAELAAISDDEGGLTRLYLSRAHRRAADRVAEWMREAGMTVSLDGTGTLIGRYEAAQPGAPTLLLGSHIDSVRNAGRFDGNLGVVTGIEVVRRLHAEGRRLAFAIEVVAFGDEEGVRFPSTLGGSRALAGTFDPAMLEERDQGGVTRREALVAFGCDPAGIERSRRSRADTIGYVEVHIEQGPVLEARNLAVGVVTAINGASRGRIVLTGKAGHAGTTPMALRRDALLGAAKIIQAVDERARREPDLVATVGQIEVPGGAVNTVPGTAHLSLDIRSPSDERRRAAVEDILRQARAIAEAGGLGFSAELTHDAPAAPCDEALSAALARSVEQCRLPAVRLPSGAGHDAMAFRGILPFAMLFVRCRDGLSHHPDEYAAPEDIDRAASVLATFIDTLTL